MTVELKKVVDDLGTAWEAFKDTHTRELAEVKKGIPDGLTAEKLAKIDAAITEAIDTKSALESRLLDLEKKNGRPGGNAEGDDALAAEVKAWNVVGRSFSIENGKGDFSQVEVGAYEEYKSRFNTYMRKGDNALSDAEKKDMMVVSDPDGGYLVPIDMTGRMMARLFETSPIRQIADVITITTEAISGINDLGEAGAGWVAEMDSRADTATPQVGKWEIPVHELYAQPRATQKVLDDASVNVEAWLAGKVADKFARVENAAFVTGDGAGKPRGFTAYTTAATADASRAWGTLEHVGTGNSGAFASSASGDVLYDVIGALKPAYLANANWVTRRTVITAVRKFKGATTGDYLWQPGLQAGAPQTLAGYGIVFAEDMPALAANSLSMAFGDFRQGYQIVDRAGISILRDPYTAKPYVRFYTTKRVGGGVVDFDAIKLVRFG